MKVLFLFLFLFSFLFAEIKLDKNRSIKNILIDSYIYIDSSRNIDIKDIKENRINFSRNYKEYLEFGYSPNFNVWIKFDIFNNTEKKQKRIIEYANPLTTNIEFYNLKKNLIVKEGLLKTNVNRTTLNPIFKIELRPYEKMTYYVKVSSHITSLIIKLNLWDEKLYYKNEIKKNLFYGFFFGAMIILILYNIFIYLFIKDISYFFYVLYLLGIIIHHSLYIGLANLYFFNPLQMKFIVENASLFISIPVLALSFFIKSFLNTKQYRVYDKLLNILIISLFISILIFFIANDFYKYRNTMAIILMIYIFFFTVYATIKKNSQAYIILLGWFVVLIAGINMYFTNAGILNPTYGFSKFNEISFLLEALIFSIALAKRINSIEKEKELVTEKLIYQKNTENIRLGKLVQEKTKDLKLSLKNNKVLLKELNHRVKNNMQMIISLLRIHQHITKDKNTKELIGTVYNRINSISEVHEILSIQNNQKYINSKKYFCNLINTISMSYERSDVRIDIASISLRAKDAIYCGLIVNEMVTNSFKYAKNENGVIIVISLSKNKEKFQLEIKDNGKEIFHKKDTSMGLTLVESLAIHQLKGNLNINTNNGFSILIEWS